MALALSEEPTSVRPRPRRPAEFASCWDCDENRWGADLRSAVGRLEARVHGLEGQSLRSERRGSELAGLAQALTEEQRALLIRLDRLEDVKRHVQVPEDRLGRLEQEHRTLALELRLTASVSEEAQAKQQQRLRALEEALAARLRKLEGAEEEGRRWAPDALEAKEASRLCEEMDTKLASLSASVEELRDAQAGLPRRSNSLSPKSSDLASKVERLELFCCGLEDQLLLLEPPAAPAAPEEVAMAEKLRELEVRVEMQGHRLSATEERWQSCSERLEKIVPLAQLRGVCREEVLKKLCEEELLGTAGAVALQREALNELQLEMQRLTDRLQLLGLRAVTSM